MKLPESGIQKIRLGICNTYLIMGEKGTILVDAEQAGWEGSFFRQLEAPPACRCKNHMPWAWPSVSGPILAHHDGVPLGCTIPFFPPDVHRLLLVGPLWN
jgi:hypothetical protein